MFVNQRAADGYRLDESVNDNLGAFFVGIAVAADFAVVVKVAFAAFAVFQQAESHIAAGTDFRQLKVQRQRRELSLFIQQNQSRILFDVDTDGPAGEFDAVNGLEAVTVVVFDNQIGRSENKLIGN